MRQAPPSQHPLRPDPALCRANHATAPCNLGGLSAGASFSRVPTVSPLPAGAHPQCAESEQLAGECFRHLGAATERTIPMATTGSPAPSPSDQRFATKAAERRWPVQASRGWQFFDRLRPGAGRLAPSSKRPVHGRRRGPGRSIGGHHVRARIGGHHRPSAITGGDTGPLGGMRAAEQGAALPGRPADGRGDHPRHAPGRAGPIRGQDPRADRDPVARRACGSARRSRSPRPIWTRRPGRCWSAPARAGSEGWSGWTTGAWEHVARWTEHRVQLPIGPLFCILAGPTRGRGWSATAARGELRRLAARPGCGGGSRHTSCGMRTRSRWRTKGSRCRLSRGSSGMRTSGSRRSISKESTRARSSTRSTTAGLR